MSPVVRFYDATLTEGPANGDLAMEQRQALARELDQSHVDFIETGMTWSASGRPRQYHAVEHFRPRYAQVAHQVRLEPGVDAVALVQAALQARTPVLTLQGPLEAAPQHREAYRQAWAQSVNLAREHGRYVIVKFTDFYPTYPQDPQWARDMLATVWEAGADVLTLGDAQGSSLPWQVATITHEVRRRFPQTPLGFWMANANACADDNALSAVAQGATLIHGTLHGYGNGHQGYTDLACVGAALWRQHQARFSPQDLEHLWDWSEQLHQWLYGPSR